MATFISKYSSYGITLPSKKTARFRNNLFTTEDNELTEELRQSKACGRDFSEVAEAVPVEGDETGTKGKKK